MNGYVAAGYGITLLGLGAYALHVLRRARQLRGRITDIGDAPR
ncbi:MAG: hypothetical protein WD232_00050 [Acidimicrobiales bacterium]